MYGATPSEKMRFWFEVKFSRDVQALLHEFFQLDLIENKIDLLFCALHLFFSRNILLVYLVDVTQVYFSEQCFHRHD